MIYCRDCHRKTQTDYYKLNREFALNRAKQFRKNNKTTPLYVENKKRYNKTYHSTHKEEINNWKLENRPRLLARRRELRRKHYEENPSFFLLQASKCRAAKRNLEHNITEADIQIPTTCPILGIPIILGNGKQTDNSPSVDRIDNKRGYVRGNVIVVSWRANDIKGKATIDELEKIVDFYKKL